MAAQQEVAEQPHPPTVAVAVALERLLLPVAEEAEAAPMPLRAVEMGYYKNCGQGRSEEAQTMAQSRRQKEVRSTLP